MKKKKTFKEVSAKEQNEVSVMAKNCTNLLDAWDKAATEMGAAAIEVIRTAQMIMVYALKGSGTPEEVCLDIIGRASKEILEFYQILTNKDLYIGKRHGTSERKMARTRDGNDL